MIFFFLSLCVCVCVCVCTHACTYINLREINNVYWLIGAESSLRSSGSQEIPHIFGNVKVHWCHNKSPTLIPIVCARWICHKSVNIPSMARSSKWYLFQGFHTKTVNVCSVLWMLQTQPFCPWFGHHDKCQGVQEFFMMQFSPASCYFLTLRSKYPP